MKKLLILSAAILLSANVNAGISQLTFHSRANCIGFNESISWHAGVSYKLMTLSQHRLYNGWGLQKQHFALGS